MTYIPSSLSGRRNSGFQFRSTSTSVLQKPSSVRNEAASISSSVPLNVQDQQPSSIVVVGVTPNSSGSSLGSSSSAGGGSHLEGGVCHTPPTTPLRSVGPPVGPQKTPVPKPRMNSTRNKTNPPPPPRPTPRNNVEESNNTRL